MTTVYRPRSTLLLDQAFSVRGQCPWSQLVGSFWAGLPPGPLSFAESRSTPLCETIAAWTSYARAGAPHPPSSSSAPWQRPSAACPIYVYGGPICKADHCEPRGCACHAD